MNPLRFIFIVLLLVICGCNSGSNTVVWISLDALRHDYVERFHPPTLTRLEREGAYTNQEIPIFPSITFPNHIAQATGTTVDHHGIPRNDFFDTETGQSFSYPEGGDALRAEPIWITARRQGVRVAALDWPMSHLQSGPWKSDYFFEHFESQSDGQRLKKVTDVLAADKIQPPLRLVMTYASRIDSIGHRNGPDSPELAQAVMETDALVGQLFDSTVKWFNATHGPEDELYFLVTTDHGMQQIHTVVSLDRVLGVDLIHGAKILSGEPVALIYLNALPPDQRQSRAEQIVAKLRQYDFLTAWKREDIPKELHFDDPTRIGDVLVLAKPGYNTTSQRLAATQPVPPGMSVAVHGYIPAECPNMLGTAIIWRYRHPYGGVELGAVRNTQWHATVAHILNIDPAVDSDRELINLP